jgi:hypothetical protein
MTKGIVQRATPCTKTEGEIGGPGIQQRDRTHYNRRRAVGRPFNLTPHQQREAIRRRDRDGEPVREIARSYNVSPATISRLT